MFSITPNTTSVIRPRLSVGICKLRFETRPFTRFVANTLLVLTVRVCGNVPDIVTVLANGAWPRVQLLTSISSSDRPASVSEPILP